MLRVLTAPDKNSTEQANILCTKVEKLSQTLKNNSLYQYETLLAYCHALMPSLQYPLGGSLLQESQCEHIQFPAMTIILQKCGIVSTITQDIVHGPSRYCGLNFTNMHTESGCQKICLPLSHIPKGDKTRGILNVALYLLPHMLYPSQAIGKVF